MFEPKPFEVVFSRIGAPVDMVKEIVLLRVFTKAGTPIEAVQQAINQMPIEAQIFIRKGQQLRIEVTTL